MGVEINFSVFLGFLEVGDVERLTRNWFCQKEWLFGKVYKILELGK